MAHATPQTNNRNITPQATGFSQIHSRGGGEGGGQAMSVLLSWHEKVRRLMSRRRTTCSQANAPNSSSRLPVLAALSESWRIDGQSEALAIGATHVDISVAHTYLPTYLPSMMIYRKKLLPCSHAISTPVRSVELDVSDRIEERVTDAVQTLDDCTAMCHVPCMPAPGGDGHVDSHSDPAGRSGNLDLRGLLIKT